MHPKPYTTLILAVGLLMTAAMLVPGNAYGKAYVADIVMVKGAGMTFQVRDWDGRLVEVEVPSQSIRDIQISNGDSQRMGRSMEQNDRTVAATVMSVDEQNDSITVRTQYGQTIVLAISTEDIQIGETLTLVAARQP